MEDMTMFFLGIILGIIFTSLMASILTDSQTKDLADAICLERHGTHYDYFETSGWNNIEKIICKKPVKEKDKYDGLVVEIGR